MKRATEHLLRRAKDGVAAAIDDVELAEKQLALAAGLEQLPATALDMPGDFRATLGTLRRQAEELGEMISDKAVAS